jgi:UDP-N-acetylglucosamine--N-acetylmuramyl-(pentapeptide) pyrophosphoryl-undecaprenol N-acetylglucosamine transferase
MKKIILTGGGTAGHVTPNIALVPALQDAGFKVAYIGSKNGIEKNLIQNIGIDYYAISSGKLRRYFDLKNFSDPFRVLKGYNEAKKILRMEKPDVIFSKGGFVSVPVVLAAKTLHIPAVIHESDMTPGLANKIAAKGASYFCCNFPETLKLLPEGKAVLSGTPIREELFNGTAQAGRSFTGLDDDKPVLLIIGGSQGSMAINDAVRTLISSSNEDSGLLADFNVVHLCGKGNIDESLAGKKGYVQYEYIGKELPDLFAMADVVISRAGANAICELLSLKKPNILIPLPLSQSRGDQILNAKSFEKQGFSYLLEEDKETVSAESLEAAVHEVYNNRERFVKAMSESDSSDSIKIIVDLLKKLAK